MTSKQRLDISAKQWAILMVCKYILKDNEKANWCLVPSFPNAITLDFLGTDSGISVHPFISPEGLMTSMQTHDVGRVWIDGFSSSYGFITEKANSSLLSQAIARVAWSD